MKIKKLVEDAIRPSYGSEGAACFDISCVQVRGVSKHDADILNKHIHLINQNLDCWSVYTLKPKESKVFRTGLAFEVPEGKVMLVFSRSGHGFNNGVRLANCVGVIDSDYRGELKVKLTNDSDKPLEITNGARIAQAMLVSYDPVMFEEVEELSETYRGIGGFGSTGA